MNRLIKIIKNEIIQQTRRKAVWIGILAGALYLLNDCCRKCPPNDSPALTNSVYLYELVSADVGMILFIIIAVLCADRILKDKKTECFDILLSTTMKKMEYYFGKIIANVLLFSIVGLVYIIAAYYIFQIRNPLKIYIHNPSFLYFMLFYLLNTVFRVIVAVIFSVSFTVIFRNNIISVIISMLYSFFDLLFAQFKTAVYYFSIAVEGYYSELMQFVLVPSQFKEYNENTIVFYTHFTIAKGIISLLLIAALSALLCTLGAIIFTKNEHRPSSVSLVQYIRGISAKVGV